MSSLKIPTYPRKKHINIHTKIYTQTHLNTNGYTQLHIGILTDTPSHTKYDLEVALLKFENPKLVNVLDSAHKIWIITIYWWIQY